jgi:hypothetical protein
MTADWYTCVDGSLRHPIFGSIHRDGETFRWRPPAPQGSDAPRYGFAGIACADLETCMRAIADEWTRGMPDSAPFSDEWRLRQLLAGYERPQ